MKRLFYLIGFLVASVLFIILFCDYKIITTSKGFLYNDIDILPYNRVGLVLGTSKYARGGGANLYFQRRVQAVVDLYNAGKITYIIVSGDNGTKEYNEPRDMQAALMKAGVPESHIYLDYAGFRTYDSVIRANKIFGQTEFTVISQQFHNERAIFIAREKGLQVIGFNAEDVEGYNSLRTRVREKFARVNVFTDIILNKQPKFLGEKIPIGQ